MQERESIISMTTSRDSRYLLVGAQSSAHDPLSGIKQLLLHACGWRSLPATYVSMLIKSE